MPKPQVLAPAGDLAALKAALAAGADAVYFGLREGFNARARTGNFALADLAATVARIHRAGAEAHLAVNTLVFEPELPVVERVLLHAAECGVDALIVQDPAVAVLARSIAPALPVHASTQMTISSAEGAAFAASLGASRVVVPRELSVAEIRRLAADAGLEIEVFIHGALCVSWSGQCLTSEAWGGRSANRGQCAQSCRLPYDLVLDGAVRPLDDLAYLLSPKDLAGLRAVGDLVDVGVHGLKIEGRQKGAAYVATATAMYRHWVDALTAGREPTRVDESAVRADLLRTSLVYTRGFGDGFLGGSDHQTLVEGRFPKHRGVFLGRVARVAGTTVVVEPDSDGRPWTGGRAADAPGGTPLGVPDAALGGLGGATDASDGPRAAAIAPRPGMGVVFDAGHPEDPQEPGGPIFAVEPARTGWTLRFGQPGPDLARVAVGQRVWITSDPQVNRDVERMLDADEPEGRIALTLTVRGRAGEPLHVAAIAGDARAELRGDACAESQRDARAESQGDARARARRTAHAEASTNAVLTPASGAGLGDALLRDKLAAFGGTPFRVVRLDTHELAAGLHLPVSELKTLRRALATELLGQIERGAVRTVTPGPWVPRLRASARALRRSRWEPPAAPELIALCRSAAQLEAVIASGAREVELDWMELVGLGRAVERARAAGLRVTLATMRVQKPGEEGYDRRLAALVPDAVLVRHWGALVHFQQLGAGVPLLHGDFSLNVTNSITAAELFERGLDTLTASHDLDRAQLLALLDAAPAERVTIVLHHRIATFHTEHCVYAHLLSEGRDFRTCGRPCERHEVGLRDRTGRTHPVIVDVGCRNTVFNSEVQSAAELVPELIARGVRRFRVELVRESEAETASVLAAYVDLLAGRLAPAHALGRARATSHYGVSAEPMTVMR